MLIVASTSVLAADAEFIWAENDVSGSILYMSTYQNGEWGEKEPIVSDGNFNILPALGSDAGGNHWVVWVTLLAHGESVLKYTYEGEGGWSIEEILCDDFKENLAPVILFDAFDTPWVFWSANNGDDDDIYMSFYKQGSWNQPQQVNGENDVPDILPTAWLDNSGNIVVSWQQLQPDKTYAEIVRTLSVTIQGNTFAKAEKLRKEKSVDSRNSEQIPAPPFQGNSRATLHFPNDKYNQSSTIKKRTDR